VQIGIGLAVAAALLSNLASLFKHRGCHRAEPVSLREPLRSARGLARSPWFATGWGLAAVAWIVHVAALSLAPISIVQAMLAGGAVTLAVMAQRVFGDPVASSPVGLVLQATAFAMVCGSALLIPSRRPAVRVLAAAT
jgi:hypothetical protein